MNPALIIEIGSDVLGVIKEIQNNQGTFDNATKKDLAMVMVKDIYQATGLAATIPFATVEDEVSKFMELAIAVYKALGKFGFSKTKPPAPPAAN